MTLEEGVITSSLIVSAPAKLDAASRIDFRCAALDCLERVGEAGGKALVIDLADTREMDACGLGLLVLVHRRARERGVITTLMHTSDGLRSLLANARLEPLFQFEH